MGARSVLLVIVAFLAVTISAGQSSSYREQTPGLSLTISAVNDTVKLGSPIKLQVTLANKLDRDITLSLSTGAEDSYRVEVRDEKGNFPPDTRYGLLRNGHVNPKDWENLGLTAEELVGRSGAVIVKLKPGKSFTQGLNAAGLYEIKAPGKYDIQLMKINGQEDGFFARSNTVTVSVIP